MKIVIPDGKITEWTMTNFRRINESTFYDDFTQGEKLINFIDNFIHTSHPNYTGKTLTYSRSVSDSQG